MLWPREERANLKYLPCIMRFSGVGAREGNTGFNFGERKSAFCHCMGIIVAELRKNKRSAKHNEGYHHPEHVEYAAEASTALKIKTHVPASIRASTEASLAEAHLYISWGT